MTSLTVECIFYYFLVCFYFSTNDKNSYKKQENKNSDNELFEFFFITLDFLSECLNV